MEIRRWSERRGKGGATDIECCRLTGGKEGRRRRDRVQSARSQMAEQSVLDCITYSIVGSSMYGNL